MLSTTTTGAKQASCVAAAHDLRKDRRVELDIHYARSGRGAIAYQVVGDGDTDLVYVPDYMSNLVYDWESSYWREFYEPARAVVPPDPLRQTGHRPLGPRW